MINQKLVMMMKTMKIIFNMMQNKLIKLTILSIIFGLSGCAVGKLNYQIDPEIASVSQLAEQVSIIAVSVTDNRTATGNTNSTKNLVYADGPADAADALKSRLLEHFRNSRLKIISNPLLADLAIEISIEKLEAKVISNFYKSEIHAVSQIRLKANKKRIPYEKIFQATRSQSVSKPATSNEVTGVINQLLSEQISKILNDPGLLELAAKSIDDA